ncbi:type IV pilus assembly protein PilM [Curtobacterium sp. C1]|uniref:type IV pilus assembly protein PilM n=1 Tax=Curtobacterium sp. C1 TaxID=2898151 RepID=UPI001E63C1F7|nr:type IV pilus assembly protein PilM [Curtobacterium sp. C1]UFU13927.1 type IV pilus assembly protein PilM [Curtobacterium sp. C1]
MGKNIVGLDITARYIRAVEVADADKARPVVVRFAEVPTPDDAVSRGEVLEPNTVASAVRGLWSFGKFRSRDVVLGMGNQRVLSRDLTVPRAPLSQVRESLPFQVQDMLPVPVIDAILDFYPTSEGVQDGAPVLHGLLVAAVKDAVLNNVRAVQLAGLNPVGVDLIPFALSRVVATRRAVVGTIAVVDLGAETTSVVILTDGVPQFVRIIPTGGDDVTKTLAARLDITVDEAEIVKQHLGLGASAQTPDDHRAAAVIGESVQELYTSLRNTVNYFVNTHQEHPVRGIVLAGGAAQLNGLAAGLQSVIRLPVSVASAFEGVATARSVAASDLVSRGSSIAVAYGLAVGRRAAA